MNANLITIPVLCQELGISKSTAYRMIKSGQISYGHIGRKIVVHRSELDRYISATTNANEKIDPHF